MSGAPGLPSPSTATSDPARAFVSYLDFFRAAARSKVSGLDETTLRQSRLPSGWTPLEMIAHLVHMERRWLVWGFLAEPVDEPWGDQDESGRWVTDRPLPALLDALDAGGRRTTEIIEQHDLLDHAATGGRFTSEPAPTLITILFHVLQEYARHLGHLDIARELVDGATGED
jgi:hypothetical protein